MIATADILSVLRIKMTILSFYDWYGVAQTFLQQSNKKVLENQNMCGRFPGWKKTRATEISCCLNILGS